MKGGHSNIKWGLTGHVPYTRIFCFGWILILSEHFSHKLNQKLTTSGQSLVDSDKE